MVNIINVCLLTICAALCFISSAIAKKAPIEITHVISAKDVKIGGSLILPAEKKVTSLVIMVSGSGPQDRDETLDGFKVFKELAYQLSNFGIASFRFDDRGVGQSTGDFTKSTLNDHANDVKAIMTYFKKNEQYSFEKFILLGHSQGCIVSGNVAIQNQEVEKVILMGPPAVPLIEIVTYQIRQEHEHKNINIELIEADVSAHNELIHAIYENRNLAKALNNFEASTKAMLLASNSVQKGSEEVDEIARHKANEFAVIYALPSLTSFLYHDTADDYAQLTVPVLGLFGGKDYQVTIAQNKDRLENALLKARVPYHFGVFEDANHYFQKAITGQREEYPRLDKRFVNGFVDSIANWLLMNE